MAAPMDGVSAVFQLSKGDNNNLKPLMQNNKEIKFQVLKGDGEILASLTYPKGTTRVWEVVKHVKEKIANKLKGGTQAHLILRSSKGNVLRPHHHIESVLHKPYGDHIVAEYEAPNGSTKNNKDRRANSHSMNQVKVISPSATMVTESKRILPDRGKASWGSFKIPLRSKSQNDVKEVSSRDQRSSRRDLQHDAREDSNRVVRSGGRNSPNDVREVSLSDRRNSQILSQNDASDDSDFTPRSSRTRRDKTTANVKNRTPKSETITIEDSSPVAANSALGSLMLNYSNDDDDDDDSEDDEISFKITEDVSVKNSTKRESSTVNDASSSSSSKRTKKEVDDDSSTRRTKFNDESSSKRTKKDSDEESSTKRTKRESGDDSSTKRTKTESSAKKKDKDEESRDDAGTPFSKGVGAFLQHLKQQESEKPKSPQAKISPTTKGWPFKRSIRTYSKQTPSLSTAFIPPASKWDLLQSDSKVNRSGEADSGIVLCDETDPSSSTPLKKNRLGGILPVTPPISSRTRGSIGDQSIEEIPVAEDTSGAKQAEADDEEDDDDVWQKDVVLLSIQCTGPISNKQLAACINGIFIDLEADGQLEALTLDELQKKLERVYQRDLSESKQETAKAGETSGSRTALFVLYRRKCIDYVYQKLRRDGPKHKKASPDVVTIGKIALTREDLYTLSDHTWLNDNIINAYMYFLSKSSKKKVFVYSTFFYTNLTKRNKGYNSVKRWTDQIDIFAQDLVLIPVHIRNHWTLAAVQVQQHRIEYYNSLGSNNPKVLGILREYLRKEASVRERHLFTALKWGTGIMKGLPQQKNGSDCGVYVCQYAKRLCYSKQVKFTTMESMNFRTEMTKELVNNELNVL